MKQRKKLIYVTEPPEGLFYLPRFLSDEEHGELVENVSAQPFEAYDHHGYKANREVVYYGANGGGYGTVVATERTEPLPAWLAPLRARAAGLLNIESDKFEMALLSRYEVGAGIGWHRDRPQFGPCVFGVSLCSDAEMRFRRFVDDREEMFKITLARGSAYIMSGPARSVWQHGMPPVKKLRYSITIRSALDKSKSAAELGQEPEQIAAHLKSLRVQFVIPRETEEPPMQLKLGI